ncbi:hypothetical protein [Polycyclovorans algicola]|uniref:hypothetical protein n=1 Tax=Polycyclovorans algicola TaxID=616992 RepID=UPI0004A77917|nr:hypothetical protein [Polycyclovorans algicola]
MSKIVTDLIGYAEHPENLHHVVGHDRQHGFRHRPSMMLEQTNASCPGVRQPKFEPFVARYP